jgi:hypothetical protein
MTAPVRNIFDKPSHDLAMQNESLNMMFFSPSTAYHICNSVSRKPPSSETEEQENKVVSV